MTVAEPAVPEPVPLVDLGAQHREVADQVRKGWEEVLAKTAFVLGPAVTDFERAYAGFVGVDHCIGVGNGTDALEIAMRALGIGPGDEAILPANSFIATALAVARAGATPVLVDVDPVHQLIDPAQVAAALTPRTKALVPVHLFGQCAPMGPLVALARDRGLHLLEDAAQSQGARQDGQPAGGFGVASGTSFYPGKNLGAYGDAGAILTDDPEVATRCRNLRNYGSDVKYHHPETGFNSRLDTLQAVVLRAKLDRLSDWNAARRAAAARYDELLGDLPEVARPATAPGNEHVWHLYVVRVPDRDQVLARLQAEKIGAGIHYPVPIHLQGAFAHLGRGQGSFPVAEAAAREILSLPLFPQITEAQQARVVDVLGRALRG
ncbi:MAG TPA: DegT/DnrJ/EryC1/StrS family aminotransferase [Polyangiaceae bacterium LLY-WYZ-14_1]|nr:DegT/DnrJ/EryC1/StrS family aminotransferase [Polyangiaceae bacterium LLY-WYZ-14_1]